VNGATPISNLLLLKGMKVASWLRQHGSGYSRIAVERMHCIHGGRAGSGPHIWHSHCQAQGQRGRGPSAAERKEGAVTEAAAAGPSGAVDTPSAAAVAHAALSAVAEEDADAVFAAGRSAPSANTGPTGPAVCSDLGQHQSEFVGEVEKPGWPSTGHHI
jgi:hypothetical protein